jgi:acetyl-CoA synthase
MSNVIAAAAIRGAHELVNRAQALWDEAIKNHGADSAVGFPNTAYFLPVVYGVTGQKIETLTDMATVFKRCRTMLPAPINESDNLSSLAPVLAAGMAALFAEELIEAICYLDTPHFYNPSEVPTPNNPWLGDRKSVV